MKKLLSMRNYILIYFYRNLKVRLMLAKTKFNFSFRQHIVRNLFKTAKGENFDKILLNF